MKKACGFVAGFRLVLLGGEVQVGGNGRHPQVTLSMHTDNDRAFNGLFERIPGGKLDGPYGHSGRHYYQWMVRGPYLREAFVPLIDRFISPAQSQRVFDRYQAMTARHGIQ